MRTPIAVRLLLFSFVLLILPHGVSAQIGVSVSFGPPALPVYEQPLCPGDGYLWTPGYWAYDDDDGYYWVPGTWVEAPQVGFLWTPGYWGWGGNAFVFHEGYWGPQVGFYGGINYGYGYGGVGYEGGRWEGSRFSYNTYVTHVNTTIIHNTYNTTVTNVTETHVSYNGGTGGIEVRPTPQQESYANQHHVGPVASQAQHVQEARKNPQLRASANQGKPPIAATVKPADFKTGAVSSKQAGGAYKPPPSNAARGNEAVGNNPARRLVQKMRLRLSPTPITPATCSPTSPHRPVPATPIPTRNISNNRKSWLPSKRRITRNSSSSRTKNTSRPLRKTTTRRKNSKWSNATLSKRSRSSKNMRPSRSRWSSTNRRTSLHQSRRALLPRRSPTKASQNQAYEWAGDDDIRSLPALFHCPQDS